MGLLACSLGVVFFGFVPDLIEAARLEPEQAWRVSAFLFASYHLVVIVRQYQSRSRVIARDDRLFGSRPLIAVHYTGLGLVAALFLPAAGFFPSWLFFFYLLNLLWLLLMATYSFAILLLEAISAGSDA